MRDNHDPSSRSSKTNDSSNQRCRKLNSKWEAVQKRRRQQLVALPVESLTKIVDRANNDPDSKEFLSMLGKNAPKPPCETCQDKTMLITYLIDTLLQTCFQTVVDLKIEAKVRNKCLDALNKLFKAVDEYLLENATKEIQNSTQEIHRSRDLMSNEKGNEQARMEHSNTGYAPPPQNGHESSIGSNVDNLNQSNSLESSPQATNSDRSKDHDSGASAPEQNRPEEASPALVPMEPLPMLPSPPPYHNTHAIDYVPLEMHRLARNPSSSYCHNPNLFARRGLITIESPEENHISRSVAALSSRPACSVSYINHSMLCPNMVEHNNRVWDFHARLKRWDPFWKPRHDIVDICYHNNASKECHGALYTVKTPPHDQLDFALPILTTEPVIDVISGGPGQIDPCARPKHCCAFEFRFPSFAAQEVSCGWGGMERLRSPPSCGDLRLICRTLPLDDKAKKSTIADTHLWPKGTFFCLGEGRSDAPASRSNSVHIIQRRQQSHDNRLWKGNCYHLDLTGLVPHPERLHHIKIFTREDAQYGIQLCLAEYQSPQAVFEEALRNILVIDYDEAKKRAVKYVNDQTVCLDYSDDDEDNDASKKTLVDGEERGAHLKFKLTCPISMTPMEIPVRGQNCKHLQCFELKNFIESNSFPSGRRWKCPCCDDFVAVSSLEVCGLFRQMTTQFKTKMMEGGGHDTVRIYQDGSWELEAVEKKKRRCDLAFEKQQNEESSRRKAVVEEIVLD